MKVTINAGHCPNVDSGAVNYNWGVNEANMVKYIGDLTQNYLEAVGFEVDMLQSNNLCGEGGQDWEESVCCLAEGSDIFISLHCNAFNTVAHGTEVYYTDEESELLAQCIQNQLVDTLGTADRGVKPNPSYMVLNHAPDDCWAVLVEIAFIDNDADCRLIVTRQDDIARAIARGVTDFLSSGD